MDIAEGKGRSGEKAWFLTWALLCCELGTVGEAKGQCCSCVCRAEGYPGSNWLCGLKSERPPSERDRVA